MLVPLYGFLAGDTLGMLVLVHDDELVQVISERLMQAASARVAPFEPAEVVFRGVVLDPLRPIALTGLTPLERVDVRVPAGAVARRSTPRPP